MSLTLMHLCTNPQDTSYETIAKDGNVTGLMHNRIITPNIQEYLSFFKALEKIGAILDRQQS